MSGEQATRVAVDCSSQFAHSKPNALASGDAAPTGGMGIARLADNGLPYVSRMNPPSDDFFENPVLGNLALALVPLSAVRYQQDWIPWLALSFADSAQTYPCRDMESYFESIDLVWGRYEIAGSWALSVGNSFDLDTKMSARAESSLFGGNIVLMGMSPALLHCWNCAFEESDAKDSRFEDGRSVRSTANVSAVTIYTTTYDHC
ncbi:hypothetical protein DE146DRAFT_731597 [Phaeosphaeria sp. MPI-PUGE-AT-0046c]|nr:hypothetical protein DE146DRAFT_731597 [Phaeosphaeria sp. MPI-PUGE-AT-0046c]